MKISREGPALERVYIEALIVGLCIGVAALLLDYWVGYSSWRLRIALLVLVGGALCLLQYGLGRLWRR